MSQNKTYRVMLKDGSVLQVLQDKRGAPSWYIVEHERKCRPRDWSLVELALAGASYDALLKLAGQLPLAQYTNPSSGKYQKVHPHKEALKRRVERAMKRAEDIEAEVKRQSGLTLKKASAAEIAKRTKFFADANKYPLPKR